MPDVARALRSVEQATAAADRARTSGTQRTSHQRASIEDREAKEKVRAMLRADREIARIRDRAVRDTDRAAKQRSRVEIQASKEETRAAEKAAHDKLRVERQVDREIRQLEKSRSRENERMLREGLRLEEKTHRDQTRMFRDRDRERSRFARGAVGMLGNAARTGIGVAGRAAGTLAQLGGGFSIADSIREMAELEKSSVMFSNAAYMGKGSRIDPKQLQGEAKAASISTGINPNELMQGAHAFLAKTGNAQEARANMKVFGEIATGTGADIEDVAKAAGTLRVQNTDLKPEDMKSLLLQTVRQGQKGSIEFSDLAGSVGKITRTASGYVGNQGKTQAELLGIAQLGMATMSDPRDVATSLAGVESDTKKHWKDMQAVLGPDTFDSVGRIKKGPSEFIADVMEKSGGDTRKLQEMGFGKQAMKYFQALGPEFQKAGGGAAGKEALLTKMKDAVAEPMGEAELQTNVQNILNTSAKQFETTMTKLKVAAGEQLMPVFARLAQTLVEHMPDIKRFFDGLASIAEWAARNPLSGLSALIAAAFAKELALAGISKLMERAMMSSGGISVASATLAITAATIAVEKISSDQANKQRAEISQGNAAYSAAMGVRVGDATTDEQLAKLTAQRDAMSGSVAKQREGVNSKEGIEYLGMAGQAAGYLPLIYAGKKAAGIEDDSSNASADYQKAREDRLKQSEEALAKMNEAIKIATENLAKLGTAAGGVPPTKPGGPAATTGIGQRPK